MRRRKTYGKKNKYFNDSILSYTADNFALYKEIKKTNFDYTNHLYTLQDNTGLDIEFTELENMISQITRRK